MSSKHNVTAEQEFALLERVLIQTADDAARCLKLLKKNLSNYDKHHGNHFINTAFSHMQSDMRTAKDTALDLKHVAHQINKNPQPSEVHIDLARHIMDVAAKSMDVLNTTARSYDEKNGRSKGVQGVIDNALGKNDKEQHEKDGGLFGNGGTSNDTHGSVLGETDGIYHHDGGILSSSDTLEQLVKTTLHDNFNISALSHQITIADKSLTSSSSFIERAKEVIHDVKDKLKGDKESLTHVDYHSRKHGVIL